MRDALTDWVGSTEDIDDTVTAWPAEALRATLDLDTSVLREGETLPAMWHWLYFLPTPPHSALGDEGHARLGGFLPPVPLPRRMFAGGRTEFLAPLRIGDRAARRGTVVSVVEKQGRTGRLVFVTVRYEISTANGLVVREEQDLVYREAATARETYPTGAEPVPDADWTQQVEPDEVLLFRFSALTFNGHRIHYDHPYTTGVEGYPALVVHGPLVALLLAGLAERNMGDLRRFSFRARSPLFLDGPFTLTGGIAEDGACELAAWSHDRRLAMTAGAEFGRGRTAS